MEIQIKKAVKAGNSSAVILPRAWLNQEVRIELVKKTPQTILEETLSLANKYIDLSEIIGIYLVGSYARNEEDKDSDIDILILTRNLDKEMIKEGIYSILFVSKSLLEQKLKKDLFPIGPMLREAKALLNEDYLDSLNLTPTPLNVAPIVKSSEEKIKMIDELLAENPRIIPDRVIYTLVLRIRTLYFIKIMLKNKTYSKKDFILLINRISGTKNAYSAYLNVKKDLLNENRTTAQEASRLQYYLKAQLAEVQRLI